MHCRKTSNALYASIHCEQKRLYVLAESVSADCQVSGSPGQMYSSSSAVCSAVVGQRIGDNALTQHQRLVGRH